MILMLKPCYLAPKVGQIQFEQSKIRLKLCPWHTAQRNFQTLCLCFHIDCKLYPFVKFSLYRYYATSSSSNILRYHNLCAQNINDLKYLILSPENWHLATINSTGMTLQCKALRKYLSNLCMYVYVGLLLWYLDLKSR